MTNTRKVTKKITSVVLTVAMLISVFCIAGTATAGAAADKVSLYSASPYFSKYGMTSYEVFVQTKDNARDQKVYIHYNYMNNQEWRYVEAEPYTTLNDGSRIWTAKFTSYNTKYCIKYVADGVTYWDNNNGRDYTYGTVIGSAPIVSEKLGYQYGDWRGFRINALLQNYAYHKNVFVRYTTDGWNSYRDQALSYTETLENGTERWSAYLPIDGQASHSEGFRYAICYRVNGTEYWANNFGADYDRSYYIYQ